MYMFSVLAAPKSVIKEIRNLQRKFIWGGDDYHRKWSLINWKMVFTPKNVGGLGLRDPLDSNKVMRVKIWWKCIAYEDEPWAKLWHTKFSHQWPKETLIRFDENPPGSSIWKVAQEN